MFVPFKFIFFKYLPIIVSMNIYAIFEYFGNHGLHCVLCIAIIWYSDCHQTRNLDIFRNIEVYKAHERQYWLDVGAAESINYCQIHNTWTRKTKDKLFGN